MDNQSTNPEPDAPDANGPPGFWAGLLIGGLAGLLIGGLAGAGAMLLMAPQSGKRTRARIQRKGQELREETADAAEAVKHAIAQVRTKARSVQGRRTRAG